MCTAMKNKIFAFILAGICLAGCSLEEKPYGFYSEGNYYKTATPPRAPRTWTRGA